jgi:choline dehydrogenase-like flavoprotein
MAPVVIVGSGPSGVHFALSVLRKGREVILLDVGHEKPPAVNPQDSFQALKENLDDPVGYLLGDNFEGVLLPDLKQEFYGIPPSKEYALRQPRGFAFDTRGFAPMFSFAGGGLAEVWTGGCYPFNDAELADFPFGYAEIGPHYGEVARRIGVSGAEDDLAKFLPLHANLLEPLDLDRHSATLLAEYAKHKASLNARLGCYLGRTRVASLSRDLGERKKCSYLGRCLWGCPTNSLYTPSQTLAQCREFSNFTYVPGLLVSHFRFTDGNRITCVVAESQPAGGAVEFPVGHLVLAAGALCSSKIFLNSIFQNTGQIVRLPGLMDNRQILVPFLNRHLFGQPYSPESYQYHQLGLGLEGKVPKEYVHGQITTLKTAMLHPIIQNLPCDMRTAIFLVRNLHCSLGIINVNLHDTRREENFLTLEFDKQTGRSRLLIHYRPAPAQSAEIQRALRAIKKALWKLGCIVPPGMTHVRPMGASAHYAGTLPMSAQRLPFTTNKFCQSHDFENLYLADGATFPFLPAKNITFSLMANAVRVAETAFD